ncbi:putative Rho-type GTPase-activating protein 4 [Erysiphe necator]|nr:putative Rho-type GTPase-activating protein 4 [Erysiphe necator]
MESTIDYNEGPIDGEEIYPCKGCGEILEEGKAFELAGNRWHLSCFRCNTCGELLDSDANLLLLGDGSLICNNCTYSCSACNNKIEDLAILTGDQAFCASCFRCRNCKRKIENLRYARTSQGIFCMSCHESLMARRKKKSKNASNNKIKKDEQLSVHVDKLLPALPPNASIQGVSSTDRKASEQLDYENYTELSPRPRQGYLQNDSSSRSSSRKPLDTSLDQASGEEHHPDGLKLQAKTYRKNRHSTISQASDLNGIDNESHYIPLALDTSSTSEIWHESTKRSKENRFLDKDYFALSRPTSKTQNDVGKSSHTSSAASTPQIILQDRGRQLSAEENSLTIDNKWKARSGSKSSLSKVSSPSGCDDTRMPHSKTIETSTRNHLQSHFTGESFTLSEPLEGNNQVSRNDSLSESQEGNRMEPTYGEGLTTMFSRIDNPGKLDPLETSSPVEKYSTPRASKETRPKDEFDTRPSLDSIPSTYRAELSGSTRQILKKETSIKNGINAGNQSSGLELSSSSLSESINSTTYLNGRVISGSSNNTPITSEERTTHLAAPTRPPPPQQQFSGTYMSPRPPPPPPPQPQEVFSVNIDINNPTGQQKLPRWSQGGGDFTMDEDFARILGDQDEQSQSLIRRVSNAARQAKNASENISSNRPGHGRSASETTNRTINSPRWPKSNKTEDIGSSPEKNVPTVNNLPEETAFLRRQLQNSEQRVTELEHQFYTEKDLKNLVKKVQEKRKTVSVLDSQTEIMIQQIEALTQYLERAKSSDIGQDLKELENSVVKDFVRRLEEIKKSVADSIEQLYEERNYLLEEKTEIMADRDRALIEFEQLSSKNAQLADMNNDLTHQIQERFKSHSHSIDIQRSPLNGLGLYSHPGKNKSSISMPLDDVSLRPSTGTTLFSMTGSYAQNMEQEGSIIDPAAELSAPHVVNIRKGQATKKTFNWKKSRQTVAKGVSKGIKGAFSSAQQQQQQQSQLCPDQNRRQAQNNDSIGLPYNLTVSGIDTSLSSQNQSSSRNTSIDQRNQGGFGLFKKSSNVPKPTSNGNFVASEKPSTLFGSELCERADYERRQIPSVVTRCIEEVELRGMDVEGIYRKTGGNSQVKIIQEGFEKAEDFDISDPALDITAVTSVLKQYLRKLPTPLLTFDVYERILESSSIEDIRERCLHLRDTFSMLPPKHRDCLEFLVFHLTRVAIREAENLMSSKNLAVVFAPTIMRDTSLEREMTDMHAKNIVVQFIIENSHDIFGAP